MTLPALSQLSLKHKVIVLFVLTLTLASFLTVSLPVPHDDLILFGVAVLVIVNLSAGFFMLSATLMQFEKVTHVAQEISKGAYDVLIPPASRIKEVNTLIEAFNVMAFQLRRRTVNLSHKAYQSAIIKEITERIGASLDVNEALEIVSGSLGKVVEYSTVSYFSYDKSGKPTFKCHLEESVSHAFMEEVKQKALNFFSFITGKSVKPDEVKSICFGTIFDDETPGPVRAFFNLPLIVEQQLVGVITVATAKMEPYAEEKVSVLYAIMAQAGTTITKIRTLITEETSKVNSMLASLSEGIIMVTVDEEIAIINDKAKEILGLGEKPYVSLLDIVEGLYGKLDFRTATDKVLKNRRVESFSEFDADGAVYKIVAGPVWKRKGEISGVVFIFFDITQEKEVDRMKSEFIAVTSHQLRTPLSSMKWFLEMLLNKDLGELPEKQQSIIQDIYNSNERVITLVNDLLDVSRLESGKITLEPTPTNLIDFFKSMLPEVEQNFKKRNQTFDFKRPDSIPRINIDPRLTWQVIQNLLTNASKYTPEGGKIALELSLEEPNLLIAVRDNGYGIPDFQKHRMFEKFFRADNVSKMEGTGLGLYIAREIAEASGGQLWFESTEGRGTTFYFSLPLSGSKAGPVRKGENVNTKNT